jgi:hypothetical protein
MKVIKNGRKETKDEANKEIISFPVSAGICTSKEWKHCGYIINIRCSKHFSNTDVPPYPQVIRSNTYSDYVKPQIIPNTIYNVIFV